MLTGYALFAHLNSTRQNSRDRRSTIIGSFPLADRFGHLDNRQYSIKTDVNTANIWSDASSDHFRGRIESDSLIQSTVETANRHRLSIAAS